MNLVVSGEWMTQGAMAFMLVSLRFLGLFLAAPMLSFRAAPLRLRLMICLVLSLALMPASLGRLDAIPGVGASYVAAFVEVVVGVAVGFAVRLGLTAVDLAAEVLSVQTGLSFASTYARDVALPSGVIGELLGMTALAITLLMNVHLILVEVIAQSFAVVPFGTWPQEWNRASLIGLLTSSFRLGLVISAPVFAVHVLFSMIQAVLGRTSPQLNLFSVGFAVSVPLGLIVLALLMPDLPRLVEHALTPSMEFIRHGLDPLPQR